eukprot:TRINITY_DN1876_c0_g1_i2.p1 TRINITY_DN1876_c0_g1~~TRINITY_DN1876_c0_g1_i2.p1  ORF type:complete len:531 (+),score=91.96 TRINITY_DN1876_c0_g1_i2:142-1593(+)
MSGLRLLATATVAFIVIIFAAGAEGIPACPDLSFSSPCAEGDTLTISPPLIASWCEDMYVHTENHDGTENNDFTGASVLALLNGTFTAANVPSPGNAGWFVPWSFRTSLPGTFAENIAKNSIAGILDSFGGTLKCDQTTWDAPLPLNSQQEIINTQCSITGIPLTMKTDGFDNTGAAFRAPTPLTYDLPPCQLKVDAYAQNVCFPPSATLTMSDGVTRRRIDAIATGDLVQCVDHGTGLRSVCAVTTFCTAMPGGEYQYTVLHYVDAEGEERTHSLTPDHYLWADIVNANERTLMGVRRSGQADTDTEEGIAFVPRGGLYMAQDLAAGDIIFVNADNSSATLTPVTLTHVDTEEREGAYGIMTSSGMFLVDDVAVTSFGVEEPVFNYHRYARFAQLARRDSLHSLTEYGVAGKDLITRGIFEDGHNPYAERVVKEMDQWAVDAGVTFDVPKFNVAIQRALAKGIDLTASRVESLLKSFTLRTA